MIGGNKTAMIQSCTISKNQIGEEYPEWYVSQTIKGFLDLSGGDSKYTAYNAKVQESTHIFICDYVELKQGIHSDNSRMTIDGKTYDVLLIDNPMELNQQLEFYLKYSGGVANG